MASRDSESIWDLSFCCEGEVSIPSNDLEGGWVCIRAMHSFLSMWKGLTKHCHSPTVIFLANENPESVSEFWFSGCRQGVAWEVQLDRMGKWGENS